MDNVDEVISAVDSGWGVVALLIVGFYVLMWRFGKDILGILKENRELTQKVSTSIATNEDTKNIGAAVDKISESIVTNHGSKNIGDAIDRITETVNGITQWQIDATKKMEERAKASALAREEEAKLTQETRELVLLMGGRLEGHLTDTAPLIEFVKMLQQEREETL